MTKMCVVFGCRNSMYTNTPMHSWPRDPQVSKKWAKFVNYTRANWKGPSVHSIVCGAHFTPEDYHNYGMWEAGLAQRLDLITGSFPTIYINKEVNARFSRASRTKEVNKALSTESNPSTVRTALNSTLERNNTAVSVESSGVEDSDSEGSTYSSTISACSREKQLSSVKPKTKSIASVNKMASEVSASSETKNAAEVKEPDNVTNTSALQPLLVSPDLLSGVGKFACTVCNETCYSLAQLAKHVQFHDLDRPFPCAICGKRFLNRSHHSEHQRVHTGERPFPCNRCERSFTTNHNLKRHQTIHNKEEMYRCTVCDVLFCQEHQLGNIGGIIRVLKQHSVDPEAVQKLTSLSEHQSAVEEQNTGKKRKFKKDNLLLDVKKEEEISQPSYHSEAHKNKDKDFPQLVHRTTPKIQKIAYDIEIII